MFHILVSESCVEAGFWDAPKSLYSMLGLASEGTPERGLAPPFESAGSESPSGGKCCEGASKGCRHLLCFPI